MKYLTPIETLERTVSRNQKTILALVALLAVAVTVIPFAMKKANPVLIRTDKGIVLSEVEPWKIAVARTEGFARAYLSDRFEWSDADFEQKRKALANLTAPGVSSKLKDSVQAFQTLAHDQKAKSYYVVEDLRFTNEERKAQAQIVRVLRVQGAALATPLRVEIIYTDTSITPENPYGIIATGITEAEVAAP